MGRRRGGKGDVGLVAFAVIVGLIASVPKQVWITLAVLAGVAFVAWMIAGLLSGKSDSTPSSPAAPPRSSPPSSARVRSPGVTVSLRVGDEEPVLVSTANVRTFERRIPARPASMQPARWVAPGASVTVNGLVLPGGMLYVGGHLPVKYGDNDPCLIDPACPIAAVGDHEGNGMGYWPSYSEIAPEHRRGYLDWLAGGRSNPNAYIGYVFLFLYGLERRVLVDAKTDPQAVSELPAIGAELDRLLNLYGAHSGSFKGYGGGLKQWLDILSAPTDLHLRPLPEMKRGSAEPAYLRMALARVAKEGLPLPAEMALAWVRLSPSIPAKGALKAGLPQFGTLFQSRYRDQYGAGMPLPVNRTKLAVEYKAASSAFRGQDIELKFGDLPDVTVLTGPIGKLQKLVEAVNADLAPLSRATAKDTAGGSRLGVLAGVSVSLWPAEYQEKFAALQRKVGSGLAAMTCEDLHTTLGAPKLFSREKMQALAHRLEAEGLGLEPDIIHGARTPKAEDRIVVFAADKGMSVSRKTPEYRAAQLMLQLSSAVATADGTFGPDEMRHLAAQVKTWAHLDEGQQKRLMAHLRLLVDAPVTLAGIKKKLEPLPAEAKEAIAEFMLATAHADGKIDAAEVRILEKAYRALSIDPKRVFSDLHGIETPPSAAAPTSKKPAPGAGLQLDHARVAELQRDTARVSQLLAGIFKDDEPQAEPEPAATIDEGPTDEADAEESVMGLTGTHAAFARALIARPHWSREEASDVAADLELMLDGALEHLNEAGFDAYGLPLTEGDDPIEINQEVLEKLQA